MYPTRRGWTVVALVVVLAVFAVVFARPLVLVGAALVGTWLLTHQYRFAQDLKRTLESLSVVQTPARIALQTGDEIPVTLATTHEAETALTLEITAGLPVTATISEPISVTLEPNTERAHQSRTSTWPVVGRHTFDEATVRATDALFRETVTTGSTPTVTVEPPTPGTIHVGEGGDRLAASYGSHNAGRTGSGIELGELREYVPGDTGAEIDWKATARHATPYVREYEAETDRRTLLVVDHRATLATGTRAETKLEALRSVALVIAGAARRLNDPLGLVTVGDSGLTHNLELASPTANYGSVRRRLLSLEPTVATDTTPTTAVSGQVDSRSGGDPVGSPLLSISSSVAAGRVPFFDRRTTPGDVQRLLSNLEGADDVFTRTLRPFYSDRRVYCEQLAEKPLYSAIQRGVTSAHGSLLTVICTDDSRPAELRETVALAKRGGNEVMVLLAPSVLYEPGGLTDLEQSYDRYVAFEEFRQEFARMDSVTALEVGPADRLSAVLEAGRSSGGRP
ncbi:DUF58 domain-containing protein [Natrinema pallidum]|uniref:DUF58 domain-containing protein n=1 Tax=Natrinema pallidum TaxID=69527 RepID=A0A4P9TJU5_9EURY|nr:DUF58 domain-containing protein [Natrinema pallidum]QCW05077.1 DUF58 domain-containing protein [Natrinema pallidum]